MPVRAKQIFNILGFLLSALLVVYLGYQFYSSQGFSYLTNFSIGQYVWALISVMLYAVATLLLSYVWALLYKQNSYIGYLCHSYVRTLLWKYLPTNVLHFVGRHVYLKKRFAQKKILLNNGLELLFVLLSALILMGVLSFLIGDAVWGIYPTLNNNLLIFVTVAIAAIVFFLFKKQIFTNKEIVKFNIYYLVFYLISVASFLLLWYIFIGEMSGFNQLATISFIYIAGWLLGFITIGSPAGIGVREGVYLLLLQPFVTEGGLLLAFLLISRIVNILAEVLLYFISFITKGAEFE